MINKVFILLIFSLITTSSCSVVKFAKIYSSSGKEEGRLTDHVYKKSSTSYKIGKLDGNWRRVPSSHGDVFFANSDNTAAINVNSTCKAVRVDSSLVSLSQSLLIGIKGKKLIRRETIRIDNEESLLSVYNAQLDENKIMIATAIFIKDGCIYDLSYSNISDNFDLYFDDFMEFLKQFDVLKK